MALSPAYPDLNYSNNCLDPNLKGPVFFGDKIQMTSNYQLVALTTEEMLVAITV